MEDYSEGSALCELNVTISIWEKKQLHHSVGISNLYSSVMLLFVPQKTGTLTNPNEEKQTYLPCKTYPSDLALGFAKKPRHHRRK